MIFSDIDEGGECHTLNISLVKSNYHSESHPPDSIDAQVWLGSFNNDIWEQSSYGLYPIKWEDGHKPMWGDYTIQVSEPLREWIYVDMNQLGNEPEIWNEDFLVIMVPVGEPEGIIRWRAGDASGMPQWYGLKSYSEGGPSGKGGWHVRHYGCQVLVVIEWFGYLPPLVNLEITGSVLNAEPKFLRCNIIDHSADTTRCGIFSAKLYYKINDGDWTQKEMYLINGSIYDGIWETVLSAGYVGPGDILTYFVEAINKINLTARSIESSFKYFKKENPILVFCNDYDSYNYLDSLWINEEGVRYRHDIWRGSRDGHLTDELVNWYDNIIQIDGYSPATMNDDVVGRWLSSGNKHYFWSSHEWGYRLTQGRDMTFAEDDWHNYFMGINTLGPQDVNYINQGDEKPPYPILPVSNDLISGDLATFLADSLQLFYYPYYEQFQFHNWIDALIPGR